MDAIGKRQGGSLRWFDLWNALELSLAAVERIRVDGDVARCNNSWERYSHFFGFDSGRGCGKAHR